MAEKINGLILQLNQQIGELRVEIIDIIIMCYTIDIIIYLSINEHQYF